MIHDAWNFDTLPGDIAFLNGIFEAFTQALLEKHLVEDNYLLNMKSAVFSIGENREIPLDEALRAYAKTNRYDLGSYDENNHFTSVHNVDAIQFNHPYTDEGKYVNEAVPEIESAIYDMFQGRQTRFINGKYVETNLYDDEEKLRSDIHEYADWMSCYFYYLYEIYPADEEAYESISRSRYFHYLALHSATFFIFAENVLLLTVGYDD